MKSHSTVQPINAVVSTNQAANRWAKWIHFSLFVAYFVPILGLPVPIVLWRLKYKDYPFIDAHGKIVANWMINLLIYLTLFILILYKSAGLLGWVLLAIIAIIYPIIGGIKAGRGEIWEYPLSVKFFR